MYGIDRFFVCSCFCGGVLKIEGVTCPSGYEFVNVFICNGSFVGTPNSVVTRVRSASEGDELDADVLREDLYGSLSGVLLDPATKTSSMLRRARFAFMYLYAVSESNFSAIMAVKSATIFRILRPISVPFSSGFSGSVVFGREVTRPTRL